MTSHITTTCADHRPTLDAPPGQCRFLPRDPGPVRRVDRAADLRSALHATITTLDWTINAYTLTFAVLLMTAAALGDRWGRRRVYVGGLLLFTGASVACALAPDADVLIAARAVQGVGAAVTMATALALINAAFPPERRGWAMGVFGAVTGVATTLGPVLGGMVTQLLAWPCIFWINVPVGLAAAAGVALRIRDGRDRTARPLDLPGLVLAGAAVLALVWGVIRAAVAGWGDGGVIASLVLGVAPAGGLVVRERRTPRAHDPVAPVRRPRVHRRHHRHLPADRPP